MYSCVVKDHALSPRNREAMSDPDRVGEGKFSRCGDKVKLFLRLHNGKITRATFQASACGHAVERTKPKSEASSSPKTRHVEPAVTLRLQSTVDLIDSLTR